MEKNAPLHDENIKFENWSW